ncbi:MAG: hypothetical protein QOG35_2237 [Solirubrobacteraceae bacterium]|nr:hypothetical protein [Solirubrobacteraceae bacterium]
MAAIRNGELELELEAELEGEMELEGEFETEEEGEEFLGTLARGAASLLGGAMGEEEMELEGEFEMEGEWEGELEGEEFFRRIARLARRAAPLLRNVARVAAPIVGTAVGGPLGGMLGRAVGTALREEEMELEGEFEMEGELELEAEWEEEGEFEEEGEAMTPQQAIAHRMADVAARAQTEAEAEAMIGASTATIISPRDRATLQTVLPHMVRGTAVLTRILRRRRATAPFVRAVPTITQNTARTLARRAAAGQPVTRRTAGRVMAAQTRRVLGNPRTCTRAVRRNIRAAAVVRRTPARAGVRPPVARVAAHARRRAY